MKKLKQDRLARCIGDVDSKYIDEAENHTGQKSLRVKWGGFAACLCLVAALAVYLGVSHAPGALGGKQPGSGSPGDDEMVITESPDGLSDDNHALFIPAIELPDSADDGVAMDMIGLVVYKGRIYTQARTCLGDEALAVGSLVGEKLGYAVGNIDEWSAQDEYAFEFASNISGDVYSVNGYSTDFRICMTGDYEDENGELVPYVYFLENLNNIGLTTGKDLFGERMNLLENWTYAEYQEHKNWDEGWPDFVFHRLDNVPEEAISAFIEAVYDGKFEYVYDKDDSGFYSREVRQAHLFFHMNDSTIMELRLFEDGYVGYQHLGWYFVKIPGEVFDTIFKAACGE